jgi:hypothetical protein
VPSQTSQVQPLPKRFTPPSLTRSFSSSKEPNVSSIADRSAPPGSPPPSGLMICQNSEWLAWPPALLRTARPLVLGHRVDVRQHGLDEASAHSVPSSAAFAFVT